jgi:RHS repeat-associated protein
MHYDAMGNITSRSDVAGGATWTYDPVHKHQVTQAGNSTFAYTYDANGNMTSRLATHPITWTSANYPISVGGPGEGSSWSYGPNRQVFMSFQQGPGGNETTYHYGRLFELVTFGGNSSNYRHYIMAGNKLVAIYSRTFLGVNTLNYIQSDHQGSIASITTSSPATDYVNESFTAFGNRRNGETWSGAPTTADETAINAKSRWGYTGQTAIGVNMGLVHMNGRIEDAGIGRFLSPDPYTPDPFNTQDYNRYSYVDNNPLTFIDPTGFCGTNTDESDLGDCSDGGGAGGAGGEGGAGGAGGEGGFSPTAPVFEPIPLVQVFGSTCPSIATCDTFAPPDAWEPTPSGATGAGALAELTVTASAIKPKTQQIPCLPGVDCYTQPAQSPKPTQCINSDGSIGNDSGGTLLDPNVAFASFDLEGYILAGGGFHAGGFYDFSTGNFGFFTSIDLGGGYGGSVGFSGGFASNLSSFQGATSVIGGGAFIFQATYSSKPGDPFSPVALSAGLAANMMPGLNVPGAFHAGKSFTAIRLSTLKPCP